MQHRFCHQDGVNQRTGVRVLASLCGVWAAAEDWICVAVVNSLEYLGDVK